MVDATCETIFAIMSANINDNIPKNGENNHEKMVILINANNW